jgi:hypothetical protein
MTGSIRLSSLDPPAMFSTGGGAALQPLALGIVAVFPIQPQGVRICSAWTALDYNGRD